MTANHLTDIGQIDPDLPVLIAGPTASGKSALALRIAEAQDRSIINADALQVWDCWQVLSARPGREELSRAVHRLYGHLSYQDTYSVGHWLREIGAILTAGERAPVIVGGTGLYFAALTEGLAEIPPTPSWVRSEADRILAEQGAGPMLQDLDAATIAAIDTNNPARVQRAWEVQRATGSGLAQWRERTAPPLVPLGRATALLVEADPAELIGRIDRRFDAMIAGGALDEVRAMLDLWDPSALWARAIGAPELVAHLRGEVTLSQAVEQAKISTRQYAKRQRTWFRGKMARWRPLAGT